ncbi:hypothetical protein [Evansella tamaricis]|uniref:Uncharacterized protein n=1 Tax=Evansella tamaricis TaxID=2069301 RepID=A0ABS6JLZ4_9BACI|nr:hypothetical protein [Evansella tamaricis]MBU9714687.1 hypothetical protein [Evansella tamaricis]
MARRTGCPNIGRATGRGVLPDGRTGCPNIGHVTGRDVLPDGRISYRAMLLEEETGKRGEDPADTVLSGRP